jgi:4-hydroxy-2-oxoheptanedioate aldolase
MSGRASIAYTIWGAHGIMAPRVDNAAHAEATLAALRYPPAQMNRANGFGGLVESYSKCTGSSLLGIVQIESQGSIQHIDAIAAVDGVDVLFVGPANLAQSLGTQGGLITGKLSFFYTTSSSGRFV